MFVFNPLTGKLEIKEGGYNGNLRDSAGNIIATVRNGLIKTVFYAQSSLSPSISPSVSASQSPSSSASPSPSTPPTGEGIGYMQIGSTFIIG